MFYSCQFYDIFKTSSLTHDGGSYDTETSPLICTENYRSGFSMIGTSLMKEFSHFRPMCHHYPPFRISENLKLVLQNMMKF